LKQPVRRWRQALWFVGLWAGGVLALAAVAYPLRLLLKP
jgi:hypothetical protein